MEKGKDGVIYISATSITLTLVGLVILFLMASGKTEDHSAYHITSALFIAMGIIQIVFLLLYMFLRKQHTISVDPIDNQKDIRLQTSGQTAEQTYWQKSLETEA